MRNSKKDVKLHAMGNYHIISDTKFYLGIFFQYGDQSN
jgi:hypothetical protein